MSNTTQVSEPNILTAKCYFWSPGGNANQRRNNEYRNLATVAGFFREIGMTVTECGDLVIGEKDGVRAVFSYSESCNNVYKTLSVTRNEKPSNITAIRKLYAK